jgi:hypothetical protein
MKVIRSNGMFEVPSPKKHLGDNQVLGRIRLDLNWRQQKPSTFTFISVFGIEREGHWTLIKLMCTEKVPDLPSANDMPWKWKLAVALR